MSIICAGLACFDQFFFIDEALKENFKKYSHSFLDSGGGPAGNAAYLLGLWGEKPYFAGKIGNDNYGDTLTTEFENAKVNKKLIFKPSNFTTVLSSIIVNSSNGSRTIITRKLIDADSSFKPNLDYFYNCKAVKPKVILIDGHEATISKLLVEAHPLAKVVLDAGKMKQELIDLLPYTSHLVASEEFINEFSGSADWKTDNKLLQDIFTELKSKIRDDGKIYVTLGELGCTYTEDNKIVRLGAFPVKAVDTTGAGDLFHGAFCFGLVRGWSDEDIITFASATSALSIQKQGVRNAIPELKEVFNLIKKIKLGKC